MEWNGLLGFPLKARCVLMCDLLLCRQMQRHRIASITKCFCFAYNRCALSEAFGACHVMASDKTINTKLQAWLN